MDRSCPIHDSRRREAERDAQDRQEVRDPEERDAVGDRGGKSAIPMTVKPTLRSVVVNTPSRASLFA